MPCDCTVSLLNIDVLILYATTIRDECACLSHSLWSLDNGLYIYTEWPM